MLEWGGGQGPPTFHHRPCPLPLPFPPTLCSPANLAAGAVNLPSAWGGGTLKAAPGPCPCPLGPQRGQMEGLQLPGQLLPWPVLPHAMGQSSLRS